MSFRTPPPDGYELPAIAADLVAHADAHGWLTGVSWTPQDYEGAHFVTVEVGRPGVIGERWHFKVTWHSRGCPPGKLRKFGAGLELVPGHPSFRDGRSVKAIRQAISDNPVNEEK